MASSGNKPERMCIACRKMHSKADLVRLVNDNGTLRIDSTGKFQGRGMYVCHSADCIKKVSSPKFLRKTKLELPQQLLFDLEGQIVQN